MNLRNVIQQRQQSLLSKSLNNKQVSTISLPTTFSNSTLKMDITNNVINKILSLRPFFALILQR